MRRFTRDEFVAHLAKLAPEWELLGDYKNSLDATTFRHKVCGNIVQKAPYAVTSKPKSCAFCNAKRLAGSNAFWSAVSKKTDYEVLGEYINSRSKILVRHKKCGGMFTPTAGNFARAEEGCPFCVGKTISHRVTKTHAQFLNDIGERADEYEFLEEYQNAHTPIRVRHLCGNEFKVTPDSFLRGSRCKACKYSTGEGSLLMAIKRITEHEVRQSVRDVLPNRSEIDIYIPEAKLGIEYDGLMYHTIEHFLGDNKRNWSAHKASYRHLWKTQECAKRGIRLIHVFEDEWLEHPDIVIDKIGAALKVPCRKMFARKLTVCQISQSEAAEFLDKNHIQGRASASVSVGLLDGDHLVAVQSFLPYTRKRDDGAYELVRYATELGTCVVGGFSRCLKWFECNYNPKKIVSFADKRWCDLNSNVYESTGFTKDSETPPNYFYVKGQKRYHKFGFRKSRMAVRFPDIYSPDKTERQMATEAGYKRIYDCGLIRYVKYE